MSGLAQLYGTYDLDADEKLKYDLYYLTRHSLALDVLILLRTLTVPLHPQEAAPQRAAKGADQPQRAAAKARSDPGTKP